MAETTTAATAADEGGAVAATTTEWPQAEPGAAAPAGAARTGKPGPAGLMLWSLSAFLLLLALLAVQVRAGGDPALGPAKPAAQAERRVIVHRVILRRVVVTERAPAQAASSGAAAPAPSTSAPAPAPPSAPAPPPAAPAPAPVATGSS